MKIGIVGCGGRMGRMLVAQVLADRDCRLAGGTEPPNSPAIGRDLGTMAGLVPAGVKASDDASALFAAADAVIDFTVPAATAAHAALAADNATVLVTGTTGLSEAEQAAVVAASKHTPILQAANMSPGLNLLLALTRRAAAVLGPEYDLEIIDIHHRHKVDAPSGTALALGRAAAAGRGVDFDSVAQRGRDGITGERRSGDIGFAVSRAGDVAGEHSVLFAAEGERVELTHKATSRAVYAAGALRAAKWVHGRQPGLYSMLDVLGFE